MKRPINTHLLKKICQIIGEYLDSDIAGYFLVLKFSAGFEIVNSNIMTKSCQI